LYRDVQHQGTNELLLLILVKMNFNVNIKTLFFVSRLLSFKGKKCPDNALALPSSLAYSSTVLFPPVRIRAAYRSDAHSGEKPRPAIFLRRLRNACAFTAKFRACRALSRQEP
jgi:hypothetical protein